tara:strand:- start:473 stop:1417 length:945 start_codon:yes stop_codon:yes gene_type:complete
MGIEEGEVISAGMVTRAISGAQKKVEVRNFGIRKHLLEYDDVMNQQRQVIYDIRNQALSGENIVESVYQVLDDFIYDEIDSQTKFGTPEVWDWEYLKQRFASHVMVDVSLDKMQDKLGDIDPGNDKVVNWVFNEAQAIYKSREALIPEEIIRGFEKFVTLRTIDEKWKDHLYAMDQLREGINLRAYGQKNPLLEYKSEGFKMFQEMMNEMSAVTIQRLFRTQLQGMENSSIHNKSSVKNIQASHKDTTGMGLQGGNQSESANQPSQVRSPVQVDQKLGRNQKIMVEGPDGRKIEIKYKKLQNYLNKGFTQVQNG